VCVKLSFFNLLNPRDFFAQSSCTNNTLILRENSVLRSVINNRGYSGAQD